jgi:hypothetical protein
MARRPRTSSIDRHLIANADVQRRMLKDGGGGAVSEP